MMTRQEPLNFEKLVDWVDGRLSQEEAAALAAQVEKAGAATQETVAWLRRFHQISREVVMSGPPAALHRALNRQFNTFLRERRGPGLWQRLTAALSFDSRLQPGLAGVREAAAGTRPRQLIYTTDVAEIALTIQPQANRETFTIAGQIFPGGETDPGAFVVQLLQETAEFGLTAADELGEFSFTAVPAGRYDLVLSGDQAEILITSLDLSF